MSDTAVPARPIEILMVDDDAGDVAFARESFAEYRLRNPVTVLSEPDEAVAYLRQRCAGAQGRPPSLVLLSLNLPGTGGRAVLDAVRNDPRLCTTPVVVLTAFPLEERILRAQSLPVDGYVRKPVDFDRLVEVVRGVDGFGLQVGRAR